MKLDQHEKLVYMMILTVRDSEERSLPFVYFCTHARSNALTFFQKYAPTQTQVLHILGPSLFNQLHGVCLSLSVSALPSAIRVFGGFSLKLYFSFQISPPQIVQPWIGTRGSRNPNPNRPSTRTRSESLPKGSSGTTSATPPLSSR